MINKREILLYSKTDSGGMLKKGKFKGDGVIKILEVNVKKIMSKTCGLKNGYRVFDGLN